MLHHVVWSMLINGILISNNELFSIIFLLLLISVKHLLEIYHNAMGKLHHAQIQPSTRKYVIYSKLRSIFNHDESVS